MHIYRYFVVILLLIFQNDIGTPREEAWADSTINRWGIVTKNPAKEEVTPPKNDGDVQVKSSESVMPSLSEKDGHTQDDSHKPADSGAKKRPEHSSPAKGTLESSAPEKKSDSKSPSATKKTEKPARKKIKWANENQKTTCEKYLEQLKVQFLKTRHYSIQGVPCDTADHAKQFLALADTCKKDCPQGLLEQSGYTNRIIRNINWLEKLGNDRCEEPRKRESALPDISNGSSPESKED